MELILEKNDGGIIWQTYIAEFEILSPKELGVLDCRLSDGDKIQTGERIIITYTDGTKQTINKSWFL